MRLNGGQITTREQPGITDLSSAELQELIALIDAHLAELDENGEIE